MFMMHCLWIRKFVLQEYEHEHSQISNQPTFSSYLGLLPLSELKNCDMVEILSFLNEFTLEMLWKTSSDPETTKLLIDTIKKEDTCDEDVEQAEEVLMNLAKLKGLPCVIGDQLTYERAAIGKKT